MNNSRTALEILQQVGAVISGSHFVGTSGKHFATYINKDALYPHTAATSEICLLLAQKAKDFCPEVVAGPMLGGIILSTWTAHHLSQMLGQEVYSVYSEKTPEDAMQLKRGYDQLVAGKKVLIVEDLTQTGGSVKKVVQAVKAAGGQPVAVCVMVNKNPKGISGDYFGLPFLALDVLEVPMYDEAACPLCRDGIPVNTTVGHGKKFLQAKGLI